MIGEVLYQIFPDRFYNGDTRNDPLDVVSWGSSVSRDCFMGGDIAGIIKKLGYIADLGATAIYLNPIFQSKSNHKYDIDDYYKIDMTFGNLDDFMKLIEKSHEKGIRIIIDGVFNHTGTDFFAFKDILVNQQESKYINWYDVFSYPVQIGDNPSYRACGGAYFLPKLNTSNPEVQDYMIKVIKYWEGMGIDGIRLDVPFEIHLSMLEKIRKSTNIFLVGEIWGYGSKYVPKYFDGITNYMLRDIIIKAVINQCIDGQMFVEAYNILKDMYKANIHSMVNLAGSHDTERIFTLCRGDLRKLKLFYSLLFLLPGIPLIYYGDEIGMEGENDPYCRSSFDWNEENWNMEIYSHIKKMINLRKISKVLKQGNVRFLECFDRVILFERYDDQDTLKIVVNFGFQNERIHDNIIYPMEYKILE